MKVLSRLARYERERSRSSGGGAARPGDVLTTTGTTATSVPSSTPAGRRIGRTRRSSAASMCGLLASGEDQAADLVAVLLEARVELHLHGAGPRELDVEHEGQAPGARGHHHDAVG